MSGQDEIGSVASRTTLLKGGAPDSVRLADKLFEKIARYGDDTVLAALATEAVIRGEA